MLVLISFGLVLIATVLLVLGLVADSGLGLIYVSIACSLAAGVILLVATRVNRQRTEPAAVAAGPAPLPPPEAPTVTAAPVATTPAPASEPATAVADVDEEAFAPSTQETPAVSSVADNEDDEMFPIADYDDLTVGEIMPLLPKLYADEIDVVIAREESGKSRRQIVARLEELRDSMEGAPDDLTAEEWAEQRPATKALRSAPAKKAAAKKAPAKKAPAKKAAAPAKKTAAKKAAPATKTAAPAKKAATKKAAAPAKKTAAKKAASTTTKKAAAPAKKATKAAKTTKAAKKR